MKWPGSIARARRIQLELAARVLCRPLKSLPRLVAAVDAAFTTDRAFAAACLYAFPSLDPVEDAVASAELRFPYVPGFLTFREGPAISSTSQAPSGSSSAHPRGSESPNPCGGPTGCPAPSRKAREPERPAGGPGLAEI